MRRLISLLWVALVIAAGPAVADGGYDTCEEAYPLSVLPLSCLPNTGYADVDPDVPTNCSGAYGKGVWFHYTPWQNGVLAASTQDSDYDTVLNVLSGSCGSLNYICCDSDSGGGGEALLALPVTGGVDYYVMLCGYMGATGWTELHLYDPQSPTGYELRCAFRSGWRLRHHNGNQLSGRNRNYGR